MMNQTIIEKMYAHAKHQPDRIAFRFINDSGQHSPGLTFQQLCGDAEKIALFLRNNMSIGSRVMLCYPPGLDYVKAFYGCLIAGMIAVPLYPPRRSAKSDRVIKIATCCQSSVVLTINSQLQTIQQLWQAQNNEHLPLRFFATDDLVTLDACVSEIMAEPNISSTTIAFLQYTSGSTGSPKGVVINHGNIASNIKHLILMGDSNSDDVFVNWLPPFHDLGLVIAILMPVYLGAQSVLMAPATFIRHPSVWLRAIDRYNGTVCGAPNFAYDLCVDKIKEEHVVDLDLSSWHVAFNAAEPVNATTLERFTARFTVKGFKQSSFYPSYGMAEATVFITGGHAHTVAPVVWLDKHNLLENKVVVQSKESKNTVTFVGCGRALPPHKVCIVDPLSCNQRHDGEIGEIWFQGPSVSQGYWQLPEQTAATFGQRINNHGSVNDPYFRSGDLGFMYDGELYVTGRIKDLLIMNGRNYYPQDIELSASQAHPAVMSRHCAAFTCNEQDSNENMQYSHSQLILVCELARAFVKQANHHDIIAAIRQQIFDQHQINVDQIILIGPARIAMTSSGKIQRNKTKQLLNSGALIILNHSDNDPVHDRIAPRTSVERVVHDIWCTELNLTTLSITDDFLAIGGNSLSAIAISAQISQHFDQSAAIALNSEQLLMHPTIEKMAVFIELKIRHAQQAKRVPTDNKRKVLRL
jgi:acyl-CoA synthetase (AMP-forming)/AMP-acid ligase II